MSTAPKYLAVYDVSDDKERLRVSKVLEGHGFRVQESVFECLLSRSMLARLEQQLSKLDLKTGFVYIYRVNEKARRVEVGKAPERHVDDGYAYVV